MTSLRTTDAGNAVGNIRACAFAVLLAALCSGATAKANEIGKVSRTQGVSEALNNSEARALRILSPVYQNDVIRTGSAARLEIALADGTLLTLGEKAELKIDTFVFAPKGRRNRMRLAVAGAFRFVSGKMRGSPARSAEVRSPVAVIGVRGTDFWGGPIDRRYGVLLLEGIVEVSTNVGAVVLDEPGEGTNIEGSGTAPGSVTRWPEAKVQRAFAAIWFDGS